MSYPILVFPPVLTLQCQLFAFNGLDLLDQHGKYAQNTAEHKRVAEIAAVETRETLANVDVCS